MGKFLKVVGISTLALIGLCVLGAILAPRTPSTNTSSTSRQMEPTSPVAATGSVAPEETSSPDPTDEPPPESATVALADIAIKKTTLRQEPSAMADSVGYVCPNDKLAYLAQHKALLFEYYRVKVLEQGESCDARRVPVGEEGWVNSSDVAPPSVDTASIPTATPEPTRTPKPTEVNPNYVSRKQFGDTWPLTVEEGHIRCLSGQAVVFSAGGYVYAVNGTAKGRDKYRDIDEIWRDDPVYPGLKINIGPLLDYGLSLCK